jgi:hypothetical protein
MPAKPKSKKVSKDRTVIPWLYHFKTVDRAAIRLNTRCAVTVGDLTPAESRDLICEMLGELKRIDSLRQRALDLIEEM